jgi:hypothetical protein
VGVAEPPRKWRPPGAAGEKLWNFVGRMLARGWLGGEGKPVRVRIAPVVCLTGERKDMGRLGLSWRLREAVVAVGKWRVLTY